MDRCWKHFLEEEELLKSKMTTWASKGEPPPRESEHIRIKELSRDEEKVDKEPRRGGNIRRPHSRINPWIIGIIQIIFLLAVVPNGEFI